MDLSKDPGRAAFAIASVLKEKGYQALFAGGCVRDFLMKKEPKDFDIATSAPPDAVEKIFPKTISVGKKFGVILVLQGEKPFEVATFRKEGGYADGRHPSEVSFSVAAEDAKRRDFTVNGLFYDPFSKKVLDHVGGTKDLEKKRVCAIGDPYERFEEDKLRLLRAIRFAANLGFEIEAETWKALKQKAKKIHRVSPERIREELVKIFTRPGAGRGFNLLSESGLMKEILPEIERMKGVEQPPEFHPEGDVFIHTRMLLAKLEGTNPSVILVMAALFHDVGKPPTYAVHEDRIRFYEHAPIGAEMTRQIMKRLRFSNDEIEAVSECVANHMVFADVQKMRSGKLKRFVSRPTFPVELDLHKVDCESSHGMLDNYYFLIEKMKEYEKEELKPKPFINGHDLMAFGMEPGPAMKPLLEELYELQLGGDIKTRGEALVWAQKKIKTENRPKGNSGAIR